MAADDGQVAAAVDIRNAEEMLAALASVVTELVNDAPADAEEALTLHLHHAGLDVCVTVQARGVAHLPDRPPVPLGLKAAPMTEAERKVLRYLPTHFSIPQLAEQLHLSRHTVKSHTVSIYRKLGVSSRPAAVEMARALGLLPTVVAAPCSPA
jgi:ATP/maltotriose-dependent transcriptional regulator MalT